MLDTWIGNVGVIGDQMLKQILGGLCVCVSLRGFFCRHIGLIFESFLARICMRLIKAAYI
jgi:hypothetical protein